MSAVATDPMGSTYAWYNPQNTQIGTDASVIITAPGLYTLVVTQDGCSNDATENVLSTLCEIQKGISVNASPDGLNDSFDLTGFNVTNLQIYNRYGLAVYDKTNYSDEWHGQSNRGDELPDGTYYYIINFEDVPTKTGWIYINREQ